MRKRGALLRMEGEVLAGVLRPAALDLALDRFFQTLYGVGAKRIAAKDVEGEPGLQRTILSGAGIRLEGDCTMDCVAMSSGHYI